MKEYTRQVSQELSAKNVDLSATWTDVPQWNWLSLDEDDDAFDDDFKRVIDNQGIPHADTPYDPETFDSFYRYGSRLAKRGGFINWTCDSQMKETRWQ